VQKGGNDARVRECFLRDENDCVEGMGGIRIPVPGSSVRCGATPKDGGRKEDGLGYEERSVKAKDDLLSWIASFLAMTLAEEG
jgi:hypothetical protein